MANTQSRHFDWALFDSEYSQSSQAISLFKQTLKTFDKSLSNDFYKNRPVSELVIERSDFLDQLLIRIWQQFVNNENGSSLVAVGGYGRAELHPGSDIDLLILIPSTEESVTQPFQGFLTFLWDIGLDVGHSVRTVADCVEQGLNDITVVTNLMEARLIIGNTALFTKMLADTGPDKIWPSDQFFQSKLIEQQNRHRRFGDTAYNLEPNIKENPGGLRDIQVIGWVVKRHFQVSTLKELIRHKFITEQEYHTLNESQNFLWRIRFGLHLLASKRDDRLQFDYQRQLASIFGYEDDNHKLAVEIFMKDYYRIVMELNRLNEMLLQLFDEIILHDGEQIEPTPINNRFHAYNGYIAAKNEHTFTRYPFALLEIFLILQQRQELKGVRAKTIRLIRQSRGLINEDFRSDVRCQSLFVEIFKQPHGLTHELRRMNRYGILARYITAFGKIVGQMQHDMFHYFTVDEHTMFLVRNLRRLTVPEFQHELPLCSKIIKRIAKPELLYLAGFFHDIGKGRGGNHSQLGAIDAIAFCETHMISKYDTNLIAWLVTNHLTMSIIAQKQDVSDPDTITGFAKLIISQERLEYLFLLTVADIRATNPTLWNSWKATLLTDLYNATRRALSRGLDHPEKQQDRIEDNQNVAHAGLENLGHNTKEIMEFWNTLEQNYFIRFSADEIIWQTDAILSNTENELPLVKIRQRNRDSSDSSTELFICADDKLQTFAIITNMIERLSLTITDARITTSQNSYTLETFILLEKNGSHIEYTRTLDIPDKLKAELLSDVNLQPQEIHNLAISRQVKQFTVAPEITFLTDPLHDWTVLELIAKDQPGLLAKVAVVLLNNKITVKNAKIVTLGARAEDVFFITDEQGHAISSSAILNKVEQEIQALLIS